MSNYPTATPQKNDNHVQPKPADKKSAPQKPASAQLHKAADAIKATNPQKRG